MSLSYCVGLVYRHPVLVVRGVELSNDVEADALVTLRVRIAVGLLHINYVRMYVHTYAHTHTWADLLHYNID